MKTLNQEFAVNFAYKVYFTEKLFEKSNLIFANIFSPNPSFLPKALVLIDSGVYHAHPNLVSQIQEYFAHYANTLPMLVHDPVEILGGELVKNDISHLDKVYGLIEKYKICRHSYIIVIGGGAVIDMVGYAASTSHRGIKLIRIPTTVLSQNDSGIGVKNSINFFGKKNFLGCFSPPFAVLNDFTFLKTLDKRDWIAGIAEAVKVALIKDKDFFNFIEENAFSFRDQNNMEPMKHLIYACAELHLNHIGKYGDPFEKGSSRPLDFGHWAAHKLEHLTNHNLRHGEAVAIGIALDTTYSYISGLLDEQSWKRVLRTISNIGFDLFVPELNEDIFKGLEEFQEHLGGNLTIMLLEKIGCGKEVNTVDISQYRIAIEKLKNFAEKLNENREAI
ncbi:EboD, Sugar phospahe cyclase superfamily [Candidatus Phycorickettsia trachydisci]|uniref:EboD, Sugar phospahe cyclase superfamily n=1 Tax=Candidatus Phycorickettsia trachydisci TaxID=2115978 RepID=A0A2P1P9X9_9RICK|nr:3-dehydroquinate synthase [Candidatus Phycorickettsia trachydisci]AVP88084.1 EboD, Sugar phospahe cyclase superfamily [Candidatus Phycorickettsia trachydisci]